LLAGDVEGLQTKEALMQTTGAELIVKLLEDRGIRLVAGIPGGAVLPLYAALATSTSIRHILARHEQAAGFIAHGIARVSGRAAVCIATSGPGVTNLITAIADAKLDSIPLVCITGQVPTALIGTDAFQEVATLDIVRSITKRSFFVRRAEELPDVFDEAFSAAEHGRPGPVLIDVPKDVQQQIVWMPSTSRTPLPQTLPKASNTAAYDRAIELLAQSKRPVLYVGGGVVKARAQRHIRALSERTQTPVTTTLMALGVMPPEHPLNLGMLGMHGARFTNRALDECDVLIAIGARFDDRAIGKASAFAPNALVVHIDIDAREFGKIRAPALAIHADAHTASRELLARAQAHDRSSWLARIRELRGDFPLRTPRANDVCTPYGIVRALAELVPAEHIVTTDVGQHQMWVAQAFPVAEPHRWLTSGGLGTMGFGLPAAIGAALVAPEATTVCVTGDGSLLMNVQELATLAELQLNVKIIVLDNASLGLVKQQQNLFYGQREIASKFAIPTDFAKVAQAFGITAYDLAHTTDARETLQRALHTRGPLLVRVPIAADEVALPMVPPGSANHEALDHDHGDSSMKEAIQCN
jgi:acetolactate synthase-1/2/3 large subunit